MELQELNERAFVIEKDARNHIRDMYCSSFLNVESDGYREAIEKRHEYADGFYYDGYLWDYLSNPVQVEENYLIEKIRAMKDVYVLWDIHSSERICMENYWNFNKDDILLLDGNTLVEALNLLPEDIYIMTTQTSHNPVK